MALTELDHFIQLSEVTPLKVLGLQVEILLLEWKRSMLRIKLLLTISKLIMGIT